MTAGVEATRSARVPPIWLLGAILAAALAIGLALWPYAADVFDSTYPPKPGRTPGKLLFIAGAWSFVAGGLAAWRMRPERRLGKLLVLSGYLLWFGGALRFVESPLAWTAGTALNFAPFPVIAYVLLAFPRDRLSAWWERVTVAMVGGFLVAAPLGMILDGPVDGLNLLSVHEIPDLYIHLDTAAALILVPGLAIVAVTLATRLVRGSRPLRRVLYPIAVPGIVFAVAWGTYLGYQDFHKIFRSGLNPPTTLYSVLLTIFLFSLVVLPVGFIVGLARTHARRALAGDLAQRLAGDVDESLQAALRRTLGDDSLVLAFPLGDRWVAADGTDVTLPPDDDPGFAVTYIGRHGDRVGAIVHDPALRHDERLLASVTGIAALAVENERLAAEVQARLAEVRASRARLVAAGDEARRRIERDLHDGAQQRLLAAALALRSTQVGLDGSLEGWAREGLERASREIDAGLSELRDLARGIHPTVLTEQGLGAALRSFAGRCPLSVELVEVPSERLPAAAEAAAFFVASEALTNAVKHADATAARISATVERDVLVVTVTDDGRGGAEPAAGGGLAGLMDRVDALDGTLTITSPSGGGTTVTARLPLSSAALPS